MNAPSPDDLFTEYLRRGEPARFADLHDLLRDELLRAAERLAPSRGAAEDLVQATFLGALESAGRFERGRKVVPWLVGILQNQARMMRWRAARTPDPQRVAWPEPRDPAELAADRELEQALAHAFTRLGPTYAPVMELHLRGEMSAQDIGKQLDRPAGTVRTQVVRGTAMLRSLLPAGLASLLLVRVTPGLDAGEVRRQLLDHATRGPVATASWLPPKALVLAAAGLLTLATAWFTFGPAMLGMERASATREQAATARADERAADAPVAARSDATAGSPLERALATAPTMAGLTVIVTHDGAPVAAMPVYVTCYADWRFHRHVAMSDGAGRVHFADLPAGRTLVSPVANRARYDEPMLELKQGERREHRVALDRLLTFEGRVVDERGAPLAGAEVWLCDGDYEHMFGFGAERVMVAGADGRFAFATAARHHFTHVQVTAPAHRASALHRLPRERGEQHTFALAPDGDAVQGTVVDAAGSPLAGVLVRAVHAGKRSRVAMVSADGSTTSVDRLGALREVRTDDAGRFRIDGFERGAMVALKVWDAPWARHDATLPAGSPPIGVTLMPGATIHGRVVDQGGKPVLDAEVASEADSDDLMNSRARTEPDGSYTLTGVTPGDAVTVTATSLPNPVDGSGGAGNATAQLRIEPGRRHEWSPVLAPGTVFRGTLRSEDGSPLDGWTFDIQAIDEIEGQNYFPVRLDERGAFEVKNVPGARYWLQFHRDDCVPMEYVVSWPLAERYDIVVPAHVEQRALEWIRSVRSGKPHAPGTIEVHGLDASSDVACYLFAVNGDGTWRWVGSGVNWDTARSLWTASLAPGQYELVVFSTQWSRDALATADHAIPFAITAGQTTALRPALQPGVRRCFRIEEPSPHLWANRGFAEVRDAAGKLVSRWIVSHSLEPAPGTFEASVALAPGRYRIEVHTDLGHRGALEFTVDSLTPFAEIVPLPVR